MGRKVFGGRGGSRIFFREGIIGYFNILANK